MATLKRFSSSHCYGYGDVVALKFLDEEVVDMDALMEKSMESAAPVMEGEVIRGRGME